MPEASRLLDTLRQTDFRTTAIIEGVPIERLTSTSPGSAGSAHVRTYTPNQVTIDVEVERAAFLVLTDIWYPGWSCRVDGDVKPVLRANALFRSVQVPAGTHTVVFTLEPASYTLGKRISGAACLCLLGYWVVTLLMHVRRSRNAADPPDSLAPRSRPHSLRQGENSLS
jgi:hypothetical protein